MLDFGKCSSQKIGNDFNQSFWSVVFYYFILYFYYF